MGPSEALSASVPNWGSVFDRGTLARGTRPTLVLRCDDRVMRWSDFEADAGRFGEVSRQRLIAPGVVLVVTTRHDGTARLSPVEPLIFEGDLWLSMMWRSRKAADLARDDRVLVHSIVSGPQDPGGEVKLRGRAISVNDAALRGRYCEAVSALGWRPEEPYFHLFRIDISDVAFVGYHPNGDQQVARWPARVEFLRRATSATSVGDAEPMSDLFDHK
jgi:hypothetical protein